MYIGQRRSVYGVVVCLRELKNGGEKRIHGYGVINTTLAAGKSITLFINVYELVSAVHYILAVPGPVE